MRKGIRMKTYKILLLTVFSLLPINLYAETKPSNVLTQLNALTTRVEKLSLYMGLDPKSCLHFTVSNASPREVYFQSKRLQEKVYQLYEEITQKPLMIPKATIPELTTITPSNVFTIVKDTDDKIIQILLFIKIDAPVSNKLASSTTKPSDVYNHLLQANQIIDQLLEKRTLASDVYQTATLSIYYAGKILSTMGIDPLFTKVDQPVINKTASAVFNLQLEILSKIQKIGKKLNIDMLTLTKSQCAKEININSIQTLAYIILSEISYLAEQKNIRMLLSKSYYPGKQYPSSIFKQNTLLLKQIDKMLDYTNKHPKWLRT